MSGNDQPPAIGTVLEDRYRLLGDLGAGGVGWVYRAEHLKLGHQVAIKMLQPEFLQHEQMRPRFEREAKALAALSHPHIVTITDYSISDGSPYLVMEMLEGRTLAQALEAGPLPEKRALNIVKQILNALIYAHQRGFVHRDLKPGNVFLVELPTERDFVKILDFGFVKLLADDPNSSALTRSGFAFGTPSYMSPQQASGAPVDARSDLYSLGIVLFEMITGHRPFRGEIPEIIRSQLTEPLPALISGQREAGPQLRAFAERATAKLVEDRFSSAAEMLASLELLPDSTMVPMGKPDPHAQTMEIELDASQPPISAGRGTTSRPTDKETKIERKNKPSPKPAPAPAKKKSGVRPIWFVLAVLGLLLAIGVVTTALYRDAIFGANPIAGDPDDVIDTLDQDVGDEPVDGNEVVEGSDSDPQTAVDPPEEPAAGLGPNPWASRPRVNLLRSARIQVQRGRPLSRNGELAIRRWAHQNRGDPRPHLVLAQHFFLVHYHRASFERYELAYRVAQDAKGDPRMLRDLVRLAEDSSVADEASALVRRVYGAQAVPMIDQELARESLEADARARLQRLRSQLQG